MIIVSNICILKLNFLPFCLTMHPREFPCKTSKYHPKIFTKPNFCTSLKQPSVRPDSKDKLTLSRKIFRLNSNFVIMAALFSLFSLPLQKTSIRAHRGVDSDSSLDTRGTGSSGHTAGPKRRNFLMETPSATLSFNYV